MDSSFLESAIRSAIISGGAAPIRRCYRAALAADATMTRSRLMIMTAATCVSLGRMKQARGWLEALMTHLDPGDVFDALRVAVDSRHADLALTLFSRAHEMGRSDPVSALLLAEKTILLAETMRLPRQHVSVWKMHMSLIEEAVKLLMAIRPGLTTGVDKSKSDLLRRARHLLGE